MKIQRITFNVKSSMVAQQIKQRILSSDVRLSVRFGRAFISDDTPVHKAVVNTMQGVIVEGTEGRLSAATSFLYDTFVQNRYGIHSITIDGSTLLASLITLDRWQELSGFSLAPARPLAHEVGSLR